MSDNKKMNQKEFIDAMALRNGTTKTQAAKEFANVMGTLVDVTADGQELQFTGLFNTEIRDVEARDYRNPQDQSIVSKDAHKKLVIKAGSKLYSAVNGEVSAD